MEEEKKQREAFEQELEEKDMFYRSPFGIFSTIYERNMGSKVWHLNYKIMKI